MAINRKKHPITFDEASRVLERMQLDLIRDARESGRVGDTRPEVLAWVRARLIRLQFAADEGDQ